MRLNHRRRRRRFAVLAWRWRWPSASPRLLRQRRRAPCSTRIGAPSVWSSATETQSQPWAVCGNRHAASATGGGLSETDAAIFGGGVALLILTIASGMLVATHRREAHGGDPAAVGAAGGER